LNQIRRLKERCFFPGKERSGVRLAILRFKNPGDVVEFYHFSGLSLVEKEKGKSKIPRLRLRLRLRGER